MRRPNGQVTDGLTHRRAHATDGCLWRGARRSPGVSPSNRPTLVALVTGLPQPNWPRHSAAIWLFHCCAVRYTVRPDKRGNHARNTTTHPIAPPRTACRLCRDAARHRVWSCNLPGHAVAKAQRLTRPQCGGHRIPFRPLLEVYPCSCTIPQFARLTPIFMSACCCCATRTGWIATAGQIIRHMQTVRPIRSPGFVPPWRPRQG